MKYDSVYVGIKETSKPQLSIYPNPATASIIIKTSEPFTPGRLCILNLNGQEILQQTISKPSTHIDISAFPTGFYIVKLTGEKEVSVGKFIKN